MSPHSSYHAQTITAPDPADLVPCSATQERFWFLDQLDPGNPALNVAIRWALSGRFSAKSLEAAFRKVIERHEILRTRFVEIDGRPFQQITDHADFRLSEIDIRSTPRDAQNDRIDAIAAESARLPFDLTQPGIIRATLIRLGNESAVLAITVHHIGFDGWSIRLLGREIGEFAAAIDAGREPELPELALQYGDYALWQEAYLTSGDFAEDLAKWRIRLRDAPYFEVRPDHPHPPERTSTCGTVTADLSAAFGQRLEAAAARRSMSVFAYGAGVLAAMLSRFEGTSEVTFGTQVAGRDDVSLEPLIGLFINDIVLRIPTEPRAPIEDHLNRTRDVVREALSGHEVPFHNLVKELAPRRDPSRSPLVSVNFILQKAYMETRRYGAFELAGLPSQAPGALHDLNFMMVGRASGWRMTLDYNADMFTQTTAGTLLENWQAAFEFAFDHADQPLGQIPCAMARAVKGRGGHVSDASTDEAQAPQTPLPPAQADTATELNDIETRLARIWCDLLGVDSVPPDANFFDLGGHSLLTIRMLSRIQNEFGRRLSVASAYRAPTLRALARSLAAEPTERASAFNARHDWRAAIVQPDGTGVPIISMNNVKLLYALSQRFSPTRPAAAVQIYDKSRGESLPERSFDEIAAEYADAVRNVQPRGPYALFGVCVHGNLAIEVARHLKAAGQEVALVILKDTWEPRFARGVAARRVPRLLNKLHFIRVRYRALRRGDISLTAFLGMFRRLRNSQLMRLAVQSGLMDRVRATDLDQEQEDFIMYLTEARDRHLPATYDGAVLHFMTSDAPSGRLFDPLMGWGKVVTGQLTRVPLPGLSDLPRDIPGVDQAARKIDALLAAQRAEGPE